MIIDDIADIVAAGGIVDLKESSHLSIADLVGIATATTGPGGLIFNAGVRSAEEILRVVRAAPGRVQVRI